MQGQCGAVRVRTIIMFYVSSSNKASINLSWAGFNQGQDQHCGPVDRKYAKEEFSMVFMLS